MTFEEHLKTCHQCAELFRANVALVLDDDGVLKGYQVPAILDLLALAHKEHSVH